MKIRYAVFKYCTMPLSEPPRLVIHNDFDTKKEAIKYISQLNINVPVWKGTFIIIKTYNN